MNLRNRALLIISLIFFAVIIIVAVVMFNVTLAGLDQIEYADMNADITPVKSSLTAESQTLLGTAQDWAWWDDMASFAVSHNQDFINRNADTDALATVKVHLFMILDSEGNRVYDTLLSPDFQQNVSLPEDIVKAVRNNSRLMNQTSDNPGTTGILLLPEGPMIISSVPILPSDKSGPSRGTLVMGRYIEYGPLQRIKAAIGYDLTFHWQNKPGEDTEQFGNLLHRLEGKKILLVVDNESMITGYSAIQDLEGKNLVLGVTMPRNVYQAGLATAYTYFLLLLLWAIMTGIIVVIVIDRTVLRRINLLARRVKDISDDREDNPLPVLKGDDELVALERGILASRASLHMRERELSGFINAIPDPAALYTPDGTILITNGAFAAYHNKRPEELAGVTISTLLSEEELRQYHDVIQGVIRTKTVVRSEHEVRGKTFIEIHYPVLDAVGNVARIGLLTFDISERKRLEIAIQKVTKKVALLNTVIFNDIQNQIFVLRAYMEFKKPIMTDPKVAGYLEKEKSAVTEIQAFLDFARQYNDMGIHPPRWQNVAEVMLFAISHLDPGNLKQEFRLNGLEIYADALLERVFVTLVKNVLQHARTGTVIRARYTINETGVIIFVEDDGPGIPVEAKESVFEKVTGAGRSGDLFLSREILSITGITIQETGEPGKGARFEMTVPDGSYRIHTVD